MARQYKDKTTLIRELISYAILGDTARNLWWSCLAEQEKDVLRAWLRDDFMPNMSIGANMAGIKRELETFLG